MNGQQERPTIDEVVRTLARLHLEVERGLRSSQDLASLMPPGARMPYLRSHTPDHRLTGGPVSDADIRAVKVQTHTSGRIYATAVTSTTPGRTGALSLLLDTRGERFALLQIVRLHSRGDYGRSTAIDRQTPAPDTNQQLGVMRDSRDQADTVRRELARRLEHTPHGDAQRAELQRTHDTWRRIHDHYHDQVAQLQERSPQQIVNPTRDRRRR